MHKIIKKKNKPGKAGYGFIKALKSSIQYLCIKIEELKSHEFERVIITKLDYIPIDKDVKYDADKNEFYLETITSMVLKVRHQKVQLTQVWRKSVQVVM